MEVMEVMEKFIYIIIFLGAIGLTSYVIVNYTIYRKKNRVTTFKELSIYRKKIINSSKKLSESNHSPINAVGFKIALVMVPIMIVPYSIFMIMNNGTNPCDVKEIHFNGKSDCLLEVDNDNFWSDF